MEEIDSVEETQVKERKCILLRIRGGKQFVLQCDVSVPPCPSWLLTTSCCLLAIPPAGYWPLLLATGLACLILQAMPGHQY